MLEGDLWASTTFCEFSFHFLVSAESSSRGAHWRVQQSLHSLKAASWFISTNQVSEAGTKGIPELSPAPLLLLISLWCQAGISGLGCLMQTEQTISSIFLLPYSNHILADSSIWRITEPL